MWSSISDIPRSKQPFTMTIEYLEREKVTVDLCDLTGRISGAYFENVYIYKKYILVAYVEFDRTCLDLLSTNKQTGNSLPLGLSSLPNLLICSLRTFKVRLRKTWTRNLRGIQVWLFDTTRLKIFLFNFPQSCLFWDCCFSKRLTFQLENLIFWNFYSGNTITFF